MALASACFSPIHPRGLAAQIFNNSLLTGLRCCLGAIDSAQGGSNSRSVIDAVDFVSDASLIVYHSAVSVDSSSTNLSVCPWRYSISIFSFLLPPGECLIKPRYARGCLLIHDQLLLTLESSQRVSPNASGHADAPCFQQIDMLPTPLSPSVIYPDTRYN
ncbi:hypothetical protein MSAN_00507200 [Mycena sanguinolenta]|uniref:Uncharacterized protein n=1 Tax=Mycena sanguinolenta TaxID=230812 RepID=A0A8H7DEZ5_9AGAR|nr:hypothetical protein MSAN_00507200 [Mycena sanguinolenta]